MNGKGQMVKTLRKNNIQSKARNVLPLVQQRKCKTNYLANKRFSLAVSGNRLNQNTHETKYTSFLHVASFIFFDVISPGCMTWLPPCKHNSLLSLSLPFPFLCSIFTFTFPPSTHPGAGCKVSWRLALLPAPCSPSPALRPTPYALLPTLKNRRG